jgi:hypothetical protein
MAAGAGRLGGSDEREAGLVLDVSGGFRPPWLPGTSPAARKRGLPRLPSTAGSGAALPSQHQAGDDEQHAEAEKGEVPTERTAQVVAHVMDAEELVVDQTLDEIEGAPPRQQHSEVNAPRRGQLPSLPGPHRQQHATGDEEPGRQVEEPVGEGVRLEAGDRTARMVTRIREQVMPLQDLMENDAVDEPTQAQP